MLAKQQIEPPLVVYEVETASQFAELMDTYKNALIIIMFYTNTCPVCAAYKPQFFDIQKEFKQQDVVFLRINSELLYSVANQFGIMAVPTTVFLKGQEVLFRGSGMYPKPQLRSLINDALKKYFKIFTIDEDMMYV